jgi:hypothetical protein
MLSHIELGIGGRHMCLARRAATGQPSARYQLPLTLVGQRQLVSVPIGGAEREEGPIGTGVVDATGK